MQAIRTILTSYKEILKEYITCISGQTCTVTLISKEFLEMFFSANLLMKLYLQENFSDNFNILSTERSDVCDKSCSQYNNLNSCTVQKDKTWEKFQAQRRLSESHSMTHQESSTSMHHVLQVLLSDLGKKHAFALSPSRRHCK